MSETTNLQSILDYYRTRCYQTEYEYLIYQQHSKEKIEELESRIRELAGEESVGEPIGDSKELKSKS